ncbi:hypothetical protein cyc_02896 [Cyclospora cayetanensis]|uniref:Uncharacterized protein n=1 Tax=Cyclospora cayetanensis TaxID=88456 RepID=A0A1D3D615_9EIME|nr:hypothetical protein cyc_02896 [Cyclospora cayetanensis]
MYFLPLRLERRHVRGSAAAVEGDAQTFARAGEKRQSSRPRKSFRRAQAAYASKKKDEVTALLKKLSTLLPLQQARGAADLAPEGGLQTEEGKSAAASAGGRGGCGERLPFSGTPCRRSQDPFSSSCARSSSENRSGDKTVSFLLKPAACGGGLAGADASTFAQRLQAAKAAAEAVRMYGIPLTPPKEDCEVPKGLLLSSEKRSLASETDSTAKSAASGVVAKPPLVLTGKAVGASSLKTLWNCGPLPSSEKAAQEGKAPVLTSNSDAKLSSDSKPKPPPSKSQEGTSNQFLAPPLASPRSSSKKAGSHAPRSVPSGGTSGSLRGRSSVEGPSDVSGGSRKESSERRESTEAEAEVDWSDAPDVEEEVALAGSKVLIHLEDAAHCRCLCVGMARKQQQELHVQRRLHPLMFVAEAVHGAFPGSLRNADPSGASPKKQQEAQDAVPSARKGQKDPRDVSGADQQEHAKAGLAPPADELPKSTSGKGEARGGASSAAAAECGQAGSVPARHVVAEKGSVNSSASRSEGVSDDVGGKRHSVQPAVSQWSPQGSAQQHQRPERPRGSGKPKGPPPKMLSKEKNPRACSVNKGESGSDGSAGRLQLDPRVLKDFREKKQQQHKAMQEMEKLYDLLKGEKSDVLAELKEKQTRSKKGLKQSSGEKASTHSPWQHGEEDDTRLPDVIGEVLDEVAKSVKVSSEMVQKALEDSRAEAVALSASLKQAENERTAMMQEALSRLEEATANNHAKEAEDVRQKALQIKTLQHQLEEQSKQQTELLKQLQDLKAFQSGPSCVLLGKPPSAQAPGARSRQAGEEEPSAQTTEKPGSLKELMKVLEPLGRLQPRERQIFLGAAQQATAAVDAKDRKKQELREAAIGALEVVKQSLKEQENKRENAQAPDAVGNKCLQRATTALDKTAEAILRSSLCAAARAFKELGDTQCAAAANEVLQQQQGRCQKTATETSRSLEEAVQASFKEATKAVREAAARLEEETGQLGAMSDCSTAPSTLRRTSSNAFFPALRGPSFYKGKPTVGEIRDLLVSPVFARRQEGLVLLKREASKALASAAGRKSGRRDTAKKEATIQILMHRLQLICSNPLGEGPPDTCAAVPSSEGDCEAQGTSGALPHATGVFNGLSGPIGKEPHSQTLLITTKMGGRRIVTVGHPAKTHTKTPADQLRVTVGDQGRSVSALPTANAVLQPSPYEIRLLGNAIVAQAITEPHKNSPREHHQRDSRRDRGRERGPARRERSVSAGSAASFLSGESASPEKRLPSAIVKDLLSFEKKEGKDVRGRRHDKPIPRKPNDRLNEVALKQHGSKVQKESALALLQPGPHKVKGQRTPGVWFQFADKEKQGFRKGPEGAKKGISFLFLPEKSERGAFNQANEAMFPQKHTAISEYRPAAEGRQRQELAAETDARNRGRDSGQALISRGLSGYSGASRRHKSEALARRKSTKGRRSSSTIPIIDPLSFKPPPVKKKLLDTAWAKYGRPPPQRRERNLVRLPSADMPENLDLVDRTLDGLYKVIVGKPLHSPLSSDVRGGHAGEAWGVPSSASDRIMAADNERLRVPASAAAQNRYSLKRTSSQLQREVMTEAAQAFAVTGRPTVTRRGRGGGGRLQSSRAKGREELSEQVDDGGLLQSSGAAHAKGGQCVTKPGKAQALSTLDKAAKEKRAPRMPPLEGKPEGLSIRAETLKAVGSKPLDLSKVTNRHAHDTVPRLSPEELRQLNTTAENLSEVESCHKPPCSPGTPSAGSQKLTSARGLQKTKKAFFETHPRGPSAPPSPSAHSLSLAVPLVPPEAASKASSYKATTAPRGAKGPPAPSTGGYSLRVAEGPSEDDGGPSEEDGESSDEDGNAWWAPFLPVPLFGPGKDDKRAEERGVVEDGEKEPPRTPHAVENILKETQNVPWMAPPQKSRRDSSIDNAVQSRQQQGPPQQPQYPQEPLHQLPDLTPQRVPRDTSESKARPSEANRTANGKAEKKKPALVFGGAPPASVAPATDARPAIKGAGASSKGPPPPSQKKELRSKGGAPVPLVPLAEYPGASANFEGLWSLWLQQEELLRPDFLTPTLAGGSLEWSVGTPTYTAKLPLSTHETRSVGGSSSDSADPGEGQMGEPQAYTVRFKSNQGLGQEQMYEVLKAQPAQGQAAAFAGQPLRLPQSVYPVSDPLLNANTFERPSSCLYDPFARAVGASSGFSSLWESMQKNRARQYH